VRKYRPDFLVRLKNGDMLVLETKGEDTEQDKAKRRYLEEWCEAVNAHGGFGYWRWAVAHRPGEIRDILMQGQEARAGGQQPVAADGPLRGPPLNHGDGRFQSLVL
jgi:type III restriction enzyme